MSEAQAPAILVVEDDPRNMILTRAILARRRCRVLAATSLGEARERLTAETPDLVLLDVRLPDGSGLDLARELRSRPSTRAVPLIAVSASVLPQDQAAIAEAGCDEFIPKPLHPAQLLERIACYVGDGREFADG